MSAPIHFTSGQGAKVRSGANTSSRWLTSVPEGVMLRLECYVRDESVESAETHEKSRVWNRVTYRGVTGFVPDVFVRTGTTEPVVPPC
jgi:hypothetical protein